MIHIEKKPNHVPFGSLAKGDEFWITINNQDIACRKMTPADARDVSDKGWRPMLNHENVTVFS